jgi:hypothetical protein
MVELDAVSFATPAQALAVKFCAIINVDAPSVLPQKFLAIYSAI